MELGDYLKKLRIKKGLSVKLVSQETEMPSVTIWAYEQNRKRPSKERLELLGPLYGVRPRILFALAGYCPVEYTKVQREMAENSIKSFLRGVV